VGGLAVSTFLYDAVRPDVLGASGLFIYRDMPPVQKRHYRALRRLVGKKRARWAFRLMSSGWPIAYVSVALVDQPDAPDGEAVGMSWGASGIVTLT
jgi:hypothetical protein